MFRIEVRERTARRAIVRIHTHTPIGDWTDYYVSGFQGPHHQAYFHAWGGEPGPLGALKGATGPDETDDPYLAHQILRALRPAHTPDEASTTTPNR